MANLVNKLVTQGPILAKTTLEVAKPKLATFLKYAKVEMVPPTPAEFPQVQQGIANVVRSAQTGAWQKLTVKEAWLNTLVAVEVVCWFFVGECIGKGRLVGYRV